MLRIAEEALTFDDVLLLPGYSEVVATQVSLRTSLTRGIELNIPLVSAAMDTVTESRLAIALAHHACLHDVPVLFTPAVDVVNTLCAAQAVHGLPKAMKRYLTPRLLVIDELGYLPMDKRGADLLFQIISARYERGSILLTTNTAYKQWPRIFNNDSTIASAVLDRLLHHCDTIPIQGQSYRMKDKA